jgi:hypothetical protein
MSLRPSAPAFQSNHDSHIIQIEKDPTSASTLTLNLGYEFPYTIQAMPIQRTPAKHILSQMEHAVIIGGTTYY